MRKRAREREKVESDETVVTSREHVQRAARGEPNTAADLICAKKQKCAGCIEHRIYWGGH